MIFSRIKHNKTSYLGMSIYAVLNWPQNVGFVGLGLSLLNVKLKLNNYNYHKTSFEI